MPKRIDLERLLEMNPQVDREQLEAARDAHRRMREKGVRPKGYDLALPFGGQRASVQDRVRIGRRIVRLRRFADAE